MKFDWTQGALAEKGRPSKAAAHPVGPRTSNLRQSIDELGHCASVY